MTARAQRRTSRCLNPAPPHFVAFACLATGYRDGRLPSSSVSIHFAFVVYLKTPECRDDCINQLWGSRRANCQKRRSEGRKPPRRKRSNRSTKPTCIRIASEAIYAPSQHGNVAASPHNYPRQRQTRIVILMLLPNGPGFIFKSILHEYCHRSHLASWFEICWVSESNFRSDQAKESNFGILPSSRLAGCAPSSTAGSTSG